METCEIFKGISNELGLGNIVEQVKRVSGGFMHKMYCLETTSGKYAVKLLNPEIMKRPNVFKNYQKAEHLEKILQKNKIPIVPSLEFNGIKMQCIDNQYLYIFNWVDGKALRSEEIRKEHCKIVGETLAKIHKVEQIEKTFNKDDICIDWDNYIKLADVNCFEIASLLKENRELLYTIQKNYNTSIKKIPAITSICNGDMDSKNVLWVNGEPQIIDLECLSYGNPYMELFQLALYWSGYEHCSIDFELLKAFIMSYKQEFGRFQADWTVLYHSNFGRVEWLEYNIKRALMIECEDEEEKNLGICQVKETIDHVVYYDLIKDGLLSYLNLLFK